MSDAETKPADKAKIKPAGPAESNPLARQSPNRQTKQRSNQLQRRRPNRSTRRRPNRLARQSPDRQAKAQNVVLPTRSNLLRTMSRSTGGRGIPRDPSIKGWLFKVCRRARAGRSMVHLRLGLPFWVNAVNETLGGLSFLFIRIRHTATAGYVYVINFNDSLGNRLSI